MKKEIKGYIIGFMFTVIFIGTPVVAAGVHENIQVKFNAINVEVNGELVEADNILYNGTTYIPFRTVAELLSKNVQYDSSNKTAIITDMRNSAETSNGNSIIYSYGEYVGDTIYNKKHGYGKLKYLYGDSFEGWWYEDILDVGTRYYNNGDVYVGSFGGNSSIFGLGEYTFANGDYFRGEFIDYSFWGYGSIYIAETGEHYVGNFYEDKYNGYGFIEYENGEVVFGYFVDGEITGQYSKMDSNGNITIYEMINGESVFVK